MLERSSKNGRQFEAPPGMDGRIAWAIAEMTQRFDRPVTVSQLAAAVNLSPSRFCHLFRDETGLSPGRYLRLVRLERARQLLENTFLSVKEVMAAVGVNDPSHFARDFRNTHGLPPREWRRRANSAVQPRQLRQ
jgi:AraC family transcriptional regulator of arabinose operon